MDDLSARLDRLGPQIEQLMSIGGVQGFLLEFESKLAVDQNTVFPVGLLTKAVTAAALGILVDEGKVTWHTPVRDAMPTSFLPEDQFLWHNLTVVDLLCHRAGISWADNLVIGSDYNILVSSKDTMTWLNDQTILRPFREQFSYSNVAFDFAGKIIEDLSGQSYYDFVQERIFDPLGMSRSFLQTPASDVDNVSKCYNTLMTSVQPPLRALGLGMTGTWSRPQVFAAAETEGLPLRQVPELMSAKIPMDQPTRNEVSYALGWQRIQLPGKMGQIGLNSGLLPRGGMPVIGNGIPSELVLFHQGSVPGLLSFAALVPGTNSAIVVLSNSLALTDVADWVGQLVLQELLNVPDTHKANIMDCAKATMVENLKWYPRIVECLEKGRTDGTSPRDLDEYVGTYWDDIHVFKIVVTLEAGTLFWAIQGLDMEKFPLKHYEYDTFTWLQPRNELSKRGRRVGADQGPEAWKVVFAAMDSDHIISLFWEHDRGVSPREFTK
ncbi:hypothetical protein PG984_011524 [Apiospora sp. TS-2023a]